MRYLHELTAINFFHDDIRITRINLFMYTIHWVILLLAIFEDGEQLSLPCQGFHHHSGCSKMKVISETQQLYVEAKQSKNV